jgi:hypothetical protein
VAARTVEQSNMGLSQSVKMTTPVKARGVA